MGLLHPDLKAALAAGNGFAVFEFDDAGGTTHRYAGSWIASDSLGMYKNFIPDGGFGNSKRAIPIRGDRLHSPTMSITVHDMDGVLNAILPQ
jgi:hypothetical protein